MAKPARTVHRPLVLCTRISIPITERITNEWASAPRRRQAVRAFPGKKERPIFAISLTILSRIPWSPEDDSEASGYRSLPENAARAKTARRPVGDRYRRNRLRIGLVCFCPRGLRSARRLAVAGWETSGWQRRISINLVWRTRPASWRTVRHDLSPTGRRRFCARERTIGRSRVRFPPLQISTKRNKRARSQDIPFFFVALYIQPATGSSANSERSCFYPPEGVRVCRTVQPHRIEDFVFVPDLM